MHVLRERVTREIDLSLKLHRSTYARLEKVRAAVEEAEKVLPLDDLLEQALLDLLQQAETELGWHKKRKRGRPSGAQNGADSSPLSAPYGGADRPPVAHVGNAGVADAGLPNP